MPGFLRTPLGRRLTFLITLVTLSLVTLSLVTFVGGCGGDDETAIPIPPGAEAFQSYLNLGVALLAPGLGGFDSLLPFLLNPGSPGASGIQWQADPSPSAPPYSYIYTIPLDGDGNGSKETTITGSCTLSGDPSSLSVDGGLSGIADFSITSEGGLGDFSAAIAFDFTGSGTELSGSGTFVETVTGNTTSINVDEADPLVVTVATGSSGSTANACAYSVDGSVEVDVAGPTGSLCSFWNFFTFQRAVAITNATYVDPDSVETELPDTSVEIPCGGGGIQDWAGTFLQDYSCVPEEFGQARLTITVTGPNTIQIVDDDPPGSGDTTLYTATVVSGNSHVVRGFFTSGDPGNMYREDFSWTLSPGGDSFTQVSVYLYTDGPNLGSGGLCSGLATRE